MSASVYVCFLCVTYSPCPSDSAKRPHETILYHVSHAPQAAAPLPLVELSIAAGAFRVASSVVRAEVVNARGYRTFVLIIPRNSEYVKPPAPFRCQALFRLIWHPGLPPCRTVPWLRIPRISAWHLVGPFTAERDYTIEGESLLHWHKWHWWHSWRGQGARGAYLCATFSRQ